MSFKTALQLSQAIEEFFRKAGYEREFFQGKLINDWGNIVGKMIADNSKIVKFDGTVLTIKTNSSVWKNELYYRKNEIIEMINKKYKMKLVSDIKII